MDFVNKEHTPFGQRCQNTRQVFRLIESGGAGNLAFDTEFLRGNLRKGSFSQPGRPNQKKMIKALSPTPRRLDKNRQVFFDIFLPLKILQKLRTKRAVFFVPRTLLSAYNTEFVYFIILIYFTVHLHF